VTTDESTAARRDDDLVATGAEERGAGEDLCGSDDIERLAPVEGDDDDVLGATRIDHDLIVIEINDGRKDNSMTIQDTSRAR
jgi:hypothetical protein